MKGEGYFKKHAKAIVYISLIGTGLYLLGSTTLPIANYEIPNWAPMVALGISGYIFNMLFNTAVANEKEKKEIGIKVMEMKRELIKYQAGRPKPKPKEEDPFKYDFQGEIK